MFGDWEGNRRSGVALAMRRRLKWFIHLRVTYGFKAQVREMSTPPTLLMGYGTLLIESRHFRRPCALMLLNLMRIWMQLRNLPLSLTRDLFAITRPKPLVVSPSILFLRQLIYYAGLEHVFTARRYARAAYVIDLRPSIPPFYQNG